MTNISPELNSQIEELGRQKEEAERFSEIARIRQISENEKMKKKLEEKKIAFARALADIRQVGQLILNKSVSPEIEIGFKETIKNPFISSDFSLRRSGNKYTTQFMPVIVGWGLAEWNYHTLPHMHKKDDPSDEKYSYDYVTGAAACKRLLILSTNGLPYLVDTPSSLTKMLEFKSTPKIHQINILDKHSELSNGYTEARLESITDSEINSINITEMSSRLANLVVANSLLK